MVAPLNLTRVLVVVFFHRNFSDKECKTVPEFISNNKKLNEMINDIQDAKLEDGGSGAFYIYLKKNDYLASFLP